MPKAKVFTTTCLSLVIVFSMIKGSIAADATENYPVKPVRIVVPFPAGGAVDTIARAVGSRLADTFKQPFVIDNRTGAGGSIGVGLAARAEPDGHTLVLTSISLAFNAILYQNLPYDTLRDLAPISLVANSPNVLVIHPSVPVKSVQELIRFAKARPGKLNYGSGGVGGSSHIAAEYFLRAAGISMVHIPYKGMPPALIDLIAGNIDLTMTPVAPALPLVRTGRLRALGVSTAKRTSIMPEVPTIAESGLPGFDYSAWYGLLATGGTPRTIITKLNEEVRKVLQLREIREHLVTQDFEPAWTTPEEFGAYIKTEITKWAPILKASRVPQ